MQVVLFSINDKVVKILRENETEKGRTYTLTSYSFREQNILRKFLKTGLDQPQEKMS